MSGPARPGGKRGGSGDRIDLVGLDAAGMAGVVAALGERPFRADQLMRWIYGRATDDFAAMTDLSAPLRAKLAAACRVAFPAPVATLAGPDGKVVKLALALADGARIEAVRIGSTVCVSCQAGCRFACAFCRTGAGGFTRDLAAGEIVGQLLAFRKDDPDHPIDRVVYMGMGEPLDNLPAVEASLRLLNDPAAFGMSLRRVTLSTVGIVPGILRLAELKLQATLAVSLHAANDALRDRLVPANRKYPIRAVCEAADRYFAATGRRVTYEYVLIDGVNDAERDAEDLARLLGHRGSHVNLIRMNAYPESELRPSGSAAVAAFRETLGRRGIAVTVRASRGGEILAACGQLAQGKGN